MQQGSEPPQVIPGDCLSEISGWYESARHLEPADQYLDSRIAEFLEAWPLYPMIMEPILPMTWLHLLCWLLQVGRRTDYCLDYPVPDKEDENVDRLLLFGFWRMKGYLICFRRVSSVSGTGWDASSSTGALESRRASCGMIGGSCVPIDVWWMIKSN